MKKMTVRIFVILVCICTLSSNAYAARSLVPVGQVIGLELRDDTVRIAGFDEGLGADAMAAGLRIGDQILKMDDKTIRCAGDVRDALNHSRGKVTLQIRRSGKTQTVAMVPHITADGPKLGLYLKEGITGIGTVTWYDPETGTFGTLGHGVSGPGGELLEMVSGRAYEAKVASVRPGKAGTPGQLRGAVEGTEPVGRLQRNTQQGVFGSTEKGWQGKAIPIASAKEIREGSATILSTVQGDHVQEYSVEILKIYPSARSAGRNLLLKVTDPALLETTGGIVQGMSGSPIIQNGKLVGAVTHVLVNDPTTGYGIFIENMLDAAA